MTLLKKLSNRIAKVLCCSIALIVFSMGHTEKSVPISSNKGILSKTQSVAIMDSSFVRTEYEDAISINIHYPQLAGPLVAQTVNKLLYTAAVTEDDVTWLNGVFKHEITYEVYVNGSIVSCLFKGYCDMGGTYADIKHAIVADWQTGEALTIDFFVSIEELRQKVTTKELEYTILLDSESQTPETKEEIDEALEAYLSQENPHINDYYIKENVVGMILYVPHFGAVCVETDLQGQRDGSSVLATPEKGDDIPPNSEMSK